MRDGRLVAAPESAASDVDDSVLSAVRAQSLELIERPLFPVGWIGDGAESLLALDPTGQVVTIEVIPYLTAQTFVAALTRAGRNAEMNRKALADLYTRGHDAFAGDYENFVESSPPITKRGPRLLIFSVGSDADVQRPLAALRGVGVETYRIVIHQGADGPLVEIAENFEARGVIDAAQARMGIAHTIDSDAPAGAEAADTGGAEQAEEKAVEHEAAQVDAEGAEAGEQAEPTEQTADEQHDAEIETEPETEPEPGDVTEPETEPESAEVADIDDQPATAAQPEPESAETTNDQGAIDVVDQTDAQSDDAEVVSDALRYDEAWEISGWRNEKARPAKRDEAEIAGLAAQHRSSREERKAKQQEVLHNLAREREQVGTTLYDQAKAAAKRAEQRLWEMSAPKEASDARIFSERFSSDVSSDAVADAALRSDRWESGAEARAEQTDAAADADAAAAEQTGAAADADAAAKQARAATDTNVATTEQTDATAEANAAAVEAVKQVAEEQVARQTNTEPDASDESAESADAAPSGAAESAVESGTSGLSAETTPETFESHESPSESSESENPTPDPRMQRIVEEVGPVKIMWSSLRKRSSLNGHLTNEGLIDIIGVGIFADPTEAAAKATGNSFVDGWRIWRVPDGRTLSEFE